MRKIFIFALSMLLLFVLTSFNFNKSNVCIINHEPNLIKDEQLSALAPLELNEEEYLETSKTVRVLFPETREIIDLDLEEYVVGVLVGEMDMNSPEEALKAMAVSARTYTVYMMNKSKNKEYDVVADAGVSQCYILKSEVVKSYGELGEKKYDVMMSAVKKTTGEVLIWENEPILALYHASSINSTENCENVFIEALPYLESVNSGESEENAYYSKREFEEAEVLKILRENSLPSFNFDTLQIEMEKNENGRCEFLYLYDDISGVRIDGKKVREIFSLRSTSFNIAIENEKLVLDVYGFGHGVGLSQNGAKILAENGKTYEEILKNYYKGAQISKTIYK